jgi:hypothetical protein
MFNIISSGYAIMIVYTMNSLGDKEDSTKMFLSRLPTLNERISLGYPNKEIYIYAI